MNNAQLNHFSKTPVNLDISRSIFQRNKRVLTTFPTGRLIPLVCEEVLPGDSIEVDFASLIRMATPIHPVMDNCVCDVHAYFVPNRLVWSHWREFMGENTASAWAPSVTYTIPQITSPTSGGDNVYGSSVTGWAKGSIADYLGLPIRRDIQVSHLPFRGYCLIWNNYYRDQNVMDPCSIQSGDSTVSGLNDGVAATTGFDFYTEYSDRYVTGGRYVTRASTGAAPLPLCRLHDYFSSCLPGPQKGPSVLMPLGQYAPVVNRSFSSTTPGMKLDFSDSQTAPWSDPFSGSPASLFVNSSGNASGGGSSSVITQPLYVNLQADLSNATAASVNALRNAFMLQRYYERLARGGSRYFEMIRAFFNVTVPDATVQIPEFLGGKRFPINMTQVAQTSSTDSTSPQGNVGAYSLTTDSSKGVFHKSFTEHGYLFIVCGIRTERSYSQGIPRHFSRLTFDDYYVPTFANAPEQPVRLKELYAGTANDNSVFGYQEAWAEYRYSPSQICGEFRPDYAQSLDSYHYGDDYASAPSLSAGWMSEGTKNVSRTLAVTSHDQWLADFQFNMKWVRPMPVYSVPGLLDHH